MSYQPLDAIESRLDTVESTNNTQNDRLDALEEDSGGDVSGPYATEDIDWTALDTQDLLSGGGSGTKVPSDGKVWYPLNFDSAVQFNILNGTGLRIQSNSGLDWTGGSRLMPAMYRVLSTISADFDLDTAVRLWVYFSTNEPSGSFDNARIGIFTGASTDFHAGRQYAGDPPRSAMSVVKNNNGSASDAYVTTTFGSSNNVIMLEVQDILRHRAVARFGAYSSGWPSKSAMTMIDAVDPGTSTARSSDGTQGLDKANWKLVIFAGRAGGSGSSSVMTIARTRIELFRRGALS